MTTPTPNELFQKLVADEAQAYSNPTKALDEAGLAIARKQQEVAQAKTVKLEALKSFEASNAARNSLAGKLTGLGMDSDMSREFFENTLSGTGSMAKGIGDVNALIGIGEGEWGNQINEYLKGLSQKVDNQQSIDFRRNMIQSTPQGDLFDPSSWSVENLTTEGILGHLASMGGQFSPQLLAMLLTRGASLPVQMGAMGTIGGAQAGGGAAEGQEQYIDGLSHEELVQSSQLYSDLLATRTPEEARAAVRDAASKSALLSAGGVGALGGMATNYILRPLANKLGQVPYGKVGTVGLSAAEEGVQEVAEGVAARASANAAIGGNQDLTEGTFTDFTLGAGFGGALGGGAALTQKAAEKADEALQPVRERSEQMILTDKVLKENDQEALNTLATKYPVKAAEAAKVMHDEGKPEVAQNLIKVLMENAQADIDAAQSAIDSAPDDATKAKATKVIEQFKTELSDISTIASTIANSDLSKKYNTSKVEEVAQAVVDKAIDGHKDAVDDAIIMAMASPEALTNEHLNTLMAQGTLTEQQRNTLEAFKVAREARDKATTDTVTSDVMVGGEGFIGLAQYNQKVSTNLLNGNIEAAEKDIQPLRRFVSQHTAKRDALTQALQQAQDGNKEVAVLPNQDGSWRLVEGVSREQAQKANGYHIHSGSSKFVNAVMAEAKALDATYKQLSSAIDYYKNKTVDSPEGNPTAQDDQNLETKPFSNQPDGKSNVKQGEVLDEKTEKTQATTESVAEKTEQNVPSEEAEGTGVSGESSGNTSDSKQPEVVGTTNEAPKSFFDVDIINTYFTTIKSNRPLASTENFVTKYLQDEISLNSLLPEGTELNDSKIDNLSHYFETLQAWNKEVNQLVSDKESKADYRNPTLLLRENGVLPENVASAISTAAYTWFADNSSLEVKTKKDINRILGNRDKNHPISEKEAVLHKAGINQLHVIDAMGKTAMDVLGLKPTKDAPSDVVNRMRTSLGLHAMALLYKTGYVERVRVDDTIFSGIERGERDPFTFVAFVRPNQFENTRLPKAIVDPIKEAIQSHKNANRGTQGIVRDLHRSEKQKVWPSTSPIKTLQKFAKRSKQIVSKLQKKILLGEQEKAHYLRQDMVAIYNELPEVVRQRIAGVVDTSTKAMHKVNREATEARNEGLKRELDHLDEFLEIFKESGENFHTPYYFGRSVWRIFRVGLSSNTIDPQTSKIHRHMLKMGGWDTTVNFSKPEELRSFKLAVADGLGIDTDKQTNPTSLLEFDIKINEPEIRNAIDALKAIKQDQDVGSSQLEAINSFHMLEALSAYAEMELAQENGDKSFKTAIMREVDGVTNGPMLTTLQLGAATNSVALGETLVRGGFMPENVSQEFYTDWRQTPGNQDLYETVAEKIHHSAQRLVEAEPHLAKQLDATQYFLGEFVDEDGVTKAGRNIAKTPITGYTFGSSASTAVNNMVNNLISSFYSKLESAVEAGDVIELREHIEQINNMLPYRLKFPVNISMDRVLEQELTEQQKQAINTSFNNSLGIAVKDAMKQQFGQLGDTRTMLNTAGTTMFRLYDAAYKHAREKYIRENIEHVDRKGGKKPVRDLSEKEEQIVRDSIKALEPVVHTAMSKMSGELDAGIKVATQANKANKDLLHTVKANFKSKFTVGGFKTYSNLEAPSIELVDSEPGAGLVVNLIHALDSTISGLAYEKNPALNVHDAHGLGLKDVEKGAKELNKQTFEVSKNYHLTMEVYEAYKRSVNAFVKYAGSDPELAKALRPEYARIQKELVTDMQRLIDKGLIPPIPKGVNPFVHYDRVLKHRAVTSTKTKLEALASLSHVDQYALEGGSYKLTVEDKQSIQEELNKLKEPQLGTLGLSTGRNDVGVVNILEETQEMSAQTLARKLDEYLEQSPSNEQQFRKAVLKRVEQVLGKDVQVKLVKPETKLDLNVQDLNVVKTAFGWYSPKDKTIYIKSQDFSESNINSELIVHEMLHAVLRDQIKNPKGNSAKAYNELESLRKAAEKYAEENNLTGQFANAFDDVDELVSWGLTNSNFQKNVLAKIQVPTKNKNLVIDGFKKFVGVLTRLFFNYPANALPKGWQTTGMNNLIVNSTILFQDVLSNKESSPGSETNENQTGEDSVLAQQAPKQPRQYTTEQVFEGLQQYGSINDPTQKAYLKDLLGEIVSKLHGPFGAYAHLEDTKAAGTPTETFLKSLVEGDSPFVSQSHKELGLAESESFVLQQVEMTIGAALEGKHASYSELNRLYNEAKSAIKETDLPNGVWHHIFGNATNAKVTKEYLSRFAAIGLVYKPLRDKMGEVTKTPAAIPYANRSLINWLQRFFSRVMSAMSRQLPDVYAGQKQDEALKTLVANLVGLEARAKSKLQQDVDYSPTRVEQIVEQSANKLREAIANASKSPIVEKLPTETLRAAIKTTGAVVGDRGEKIVDAIEDLRNRSREGRQKFMDELITEMKGVGNRAMASLLRLSNKHQQDRQFIIDQTAEGVLTSFENEGKDLTREQLSSLTRVILKADLSALVDEFDVEGVNQLILNPAYLDDTIDRVSKRLTGPNKAYYLRQAKDLGFFLARGKTVNANLMLNATTIAYMANTKKVIQGDNKVAAANEPTIDALASLYALKHMPDTILETARELVRSEMNREGDNGIATLLKIHQRTQREAFETSFGANPFSFMKGYTREQFNPHKTLVLVDATNIEDYKKMGYVEHGEIGSDPADPNRATKVMMSINKGIQPYTTGMISYSGKRSRGKAVHDGLASATGDSFFMGNAMINQQIANKKQAEIDKLFKTPANYDPAKAKEKNFMVPVIGHNGKASNYRYMMSEEVKDTVLDRNNQVTNVLGAMAGATFDKQETEVLNKGVIQALKEEFDETYVGNSQAYITFGPNSTDPTVRENYAMLPDSTKADIKRIWGSNDIKVRADQYNLVFGYRKYSLGDIWNKPNQEREITEKIFLGTVEAFFGKKAELRVRQAENGWKELVSMTKDIIVIKNLFTLLGNISANVTFLLWQGVSPTHIWKDHVKALKGITTYQRDQKELFHVTSMIESDLLGDKTLQELEQRKAELEDMIATNPVKELVDAGMFQTIIEDVTKSDDTFSYQSQLQEKLSNGTQWIPDVAKTVGKHVLVMHDTPLYKLLNKTTALSDFVARYSLHQHLMHRTAEPMSKEESLHAISEAFVNYDIPSGRAMEYLNDTGIFWFTKYFLRIQKVLFRLFRENPARGLALALFGNFFPTVPTVVDSSFYNQIGNPIGDGAFALPEAVDEIVTLKAASAMF